MIIVPIHVSGIWVPVRGGDPLTSGSIGAGLIIGEARVELGGVSAMVNGEDVGDLGEPRCGGFSISSPAPLGYGFAVSAIVALAAELTCGGPLTAAARAAHVREVLRGTGLGDVLAIYTGGCLVHRYVPGAPGIGAAEPMPCPRLGVVAVAARRVETRAMLAEYARFRVGRRGLQAVRQGPNHGDVRGGGHSVPGQVLRRAPEPRPTKALRLRNLHEEGRAHMVGGALIGILMGPYVGVITVSIALLIQALLFGDGGITTYAANCFNMAFVLPFIAYMVFKGFNALFKGSKKGITIGSFLAGYIGINVAAFTSRTSLVTKTTEGQKLCREIESC